MASLLVGAGVLSYEAIKKQNAKRKAKKARDSARFSELERDNAARLSHLQQKTCFCQTSDWTGGECDVHGYVPPASQQQQYGDGGDDGLSGAPASRNPPPAYVDVTEGMVEGDGIRAGPGAERTEGREQRPPQMDEKEIERINEERRGKKGKRWGRKKGFFGGAGALA